MKKLFLFVALAFVGFAFIPKDITWVAIGDSITYLNEHVDETQNRITKGYMTRVVEKLPYIHYFNQGYSGWNSGDIADSIETLGIQKADMYSIFLGTNDWWAGRGVGTMADYLNNTGRGTVYGAFRIIINKLHSLNKDAKIILITPMQRLDFVSLNGKHDPVHGSYMAKDGQMLEQVADAINAIGTYEHCEVVDLFHAKSLALESLVKYKRLKDPQTGLYRNYPYPDFTNIPFNSATDEYPYPLDAVGMTYDGLHPSDNGYSEIADMLVKIMKKY